MVCKSKFTFNFNINKMNKDIRRQDKHIFGNQKGYVRDQRKRKEKYQGVPE